MLVVEISMKLTSVPENWLERVALWLGIAPTPLSDTHVAIMKARTLMVAAKAGIFEAIHQGHNTSDSVAQQINTHRDATHKLLNSLVHLGYLKFKKNRYSLSRLSRKWMLQESESSVYSKIMWQFVEWELIEHYDEFLRSGQPSDLHHSLSKQQWELYQKGMRDVARVSAKEVALRTPFPRGATQLLDVGGSHGYYSVAFCQRHTNLQATILDLPEAVAHAAPLLREKGMGDRVKHQEGNVLQEDLGENRWDVVFISSLAHHFSEQQNIDLARRIHRSLKPGGYYIVQEYARSEKPKKGDHLALLDFFFAATSKSGTWSVRELSNWQTLAGLKHYKNIWLHTIPRHAQVVGKKHK